MSTPSGLWKLEGDSVAKLRCGPLRALVECKRDWISLVPTEWQGQLVDYGAIEVLGGIGKAFLEVTDFYVRGVDVVAEFAHAGSDRVAPQIYWRAQERPEAARVELIVSVRTELLDSAPWWIVQSGLRNATLLHASQLRVAAFEEVSSQARNQSGQSRTFSRDESSEHLFVFRLDALGLSYAEMVHPTDFVSAESIGGLTTCVRSELFPERLEKGVIRRGRICGWFLPVENDLNTAVELAKQFVDEPLPLTA